MEKQGTKALYSLLLVKSLSGLISVISNVISSSRFITIKADTLKQE